MSQSKNALENTARVVKIISQPHLKLEEIPPLEGTQFFSGENRIFGPSSNCCISNYTYLHDKHYF